MTSFEILSQPPKSEAMDSLILFDVSAKKNTDMAASLKVHKLLSDAQIKSICDYAAKSPESLAAGSVIALDFGSELSTLWAKLPEDRSMFALLKLARKIIQQLKERQRYRVCVNLRDLTSNDEALRLIDALVSASVVAAFKAESYKTKDLKEKKPAAKTPQVQLTFVLSKDLSKAAEERAKCAEQLARINNLVRSLTVMPANILDCGTYVKKAKSMAKDAGLEFEFFAFDALKKMKAGAFIAVAQGSDHRDAGIVKISYRPTKKSDRARVAVVGKGVTFDTGGVNVKTGNSMHGMHGDMSGSAVALGLVLLAKQQQWAFGVDAYLAIADNAISSAAYRPNEIVYALNGVSIETVHTDAEGRMMLADTLALASLDKPELIVDFATLTGSAVRAIGTNYAAGFSNQADLLPAVIAAGIKSGERCWPFPTDADYGECLDSDIADTKQCRLAAGPDHIEAAVFLSKFVLSESKWIHIDLSSVENEGGLAHVPTRETGFGIRLGSELIRSIMTRS